MVFQFEHMDLDRAAGRDAGWTWRQWTLPELKAVMTRWQNGLEGRGWNSQYFSNHDQPRQVSRFGDDGQYRVQSAKLLGTFLHLLQGTPYVYQGEEIGMTNVAFPSIEDYRDIATRNAYRELIGERGLTPDEALELVHHRSRDNARTPVQWDAGENAGFTTGTPWIGINPNYREINVAEALADPDSIFHYYQRLIRLRKAEPTIVHGRYDLILPDDEAIYAFTRTWQDNRLLVVLNFTGKEAVFSLPDDLPSNGPELLIANYPVEEGENIRRFTLRPYEARVYRLG
jgi:oligo-1,6-glucosidase